jgi:hypothetical protein
MKKLFKKSRGFLDPLLIVGGIAGGIGLIIITCGSIFLLSKVMGATFSCCIGGC